MRCLNTVATRKLVNKYVYEQLPPGVLDELRLEPAYGSGLPSPQALPVPHGGTGNAHLDRQISTVTTLMRISNSKAEFEELFERAFQPPQVRLPLVIVVPQEDVG
jgi:hypothetical protein